MSGIHAEHHEKDVSREDALEWAKRPEVDWVNEQPMPPKGWSWMNHGQDKSFLMSWEHEEDITEDDVK